MALPFLIAALKAVGIIILCVISIILFIVIITLFVPFCYNINVEKCEELKGSVRLSWLFGIIRLLFEQNAAGERILSVNIFGIGIIKKNYNQNKEFDEKHPSEAVPQTRQEKPDGIKPKGPPGDENKKPTEPIGEQNKKPKEPPDEQNKKAHKPADGWNNKSRKNRTTKKEKSEKSEIHGVFNKFLKFENKLDILNQVLILLKRLFRIITSFKVLANIKIGTGQPHSTGYILALCGVLADVSGFNIIAEGDFYSALLQGKVKIKGRIFIGSIVWVILLFVFNKNIFPIVKNLIFRKDEANVRF